MPTMSTYACFIFAFSLLLSCVGYGQALSIELRQHTHFDNFPSCSAISNNWGTLYLIGDDAPYLYIIDANHTVLDSVRIFHNTQKRIPKKTKEDLESSLFWMQRNDTSLLVLGSGATDPRKVLRILPLTNGELQLKETNTFKIDTLIDRLASTIKDINLEGIAFVKKDMVVSNRANKSNPVNHLAIVPAYFWMNQNGCTVHIASLNLPVKTKNVVGVSDLCYHPPTDRLFLSFSTELTGSAYEDGKIGDSFLGCINAFSKKLASTKIKVDNMINLSEVNTSFRNQKIEGICIEQFLSNIYTIHLASDDDRGSSDVFKVTVRVTP